MVITTSWDDGHPLDFRIAELLARYAIPGTFYIPLRNTRPTVSSSQIRELAKFFEIGAHTVNHVRLVELDPEHARSEIVESKRRIEDILGRPCPIFCFPGGAYSDRHLTIAKEAGFTAVRTVELLSLNRPRMTQGIAVIPTSVQAYPHRYTTYLRNSAKRLSMQGLGNLFWRGMSKTWPQLAEVLLKRASLRGGVFHLWGHSWEIDQRQEWKALGKVLELMSEYGRQASFSTNMGLCEH
jgi:peptidoglycan/xylan/chitin deacetylase (PgdA/CDA1 family)